MQDLPNESQTQSTLENVASGSGSRQGPSQPIRSTPTKSRIVSSSYERKSVDGDFRRELEQFQHSGISFEDFLKHAFSVSDAEMEELRKVVEGYGVHNTEEYKAQEALLVKAAPKLEKDMYEPYAAMGNMVLDRAVQDAPEGSLPAIQALVYDTSLRGCFAERKPDIVLVPKKDGTTPITKANLLWKHVLWTLEFKIEEKSVPVIGKRQRDIAETPEIAPVSDAKKIKSSRSTSVIVRNPSEERKRGTSTSASTITQPSNPTSYSSIFTFCLPNETGTGSAMAISSPGPEETSSVEQVSVETSLAQNPQSSATAGDGARELLLRSAAGPDMVSSDIVSASSATSASSRRSKSKKTTPPDIQLANYLAEVMSDRGDRSHVFGSMVIGTKMQLQFYSRSCGVISDEIDIVEDPVMHAVFLVLVSRQDFEGLGFNTAMGHCNPFNTNDEETLRSGLGFTPITGGGKGFTMPESFRTTLKKRIHTEYCLVGRGTAVYDIERPANCEFDIVAKIAWQVKTRRPEDEAILVAREVNSRHAPEIYGKLKVTDTGPTKALISACTKHAHYEERELRILLMRKYTRVTDVATEKNFVIVMVQILHFSHELYSKRGLLHRDIGIFNIAFYFDEKGEIVGVLIDFDLATYPLPSGASEPTSHHRSGTKPFMALETLDADTENEKPYTHHLIHEMESILYTMVWHGVGYRGAKYPRNNKNFDYLAGWRKGTWKEVRDMKKNFLSRPDEILSHIPKGFLFDLCTRLTAVLYERYAAHDARDIWAREIALVHAKPHADPPEIFDNTPLEIPDEPPIPSKAILPKVLKRARLVVPSWICSSDCCHDTTVVA